jgi:hypothetical protein
MMIVIILYELISCFKLFGNVSLIINFLYFALMIQFIIHMIICFDLVWKLYLFV